MDTFTPASFDLAIVADPNATPLQQTHRLAMMATAATAIELDLSPSQAFENLNRALRTYAKAASRPRKVACWDFVACELWNARADAVRSGALDRGSQEYVFVSDRYNDAHGRSEHGHTLERLGHADVRL